MPRLKVCGITDAAFAVEAARRGVDYLGLIFAEGSPRHVTVEQAKAIVAAVREGSRACATRPPPRFVGVFVAQDAEEIVRIAQAVPLDVIQLHCACEAGKIASLKSAGYEVWQLYAPTGGACADALLLDGRKGTQCGGTGVCADWAQVTALKRAGHRVVLAGGLSAANIAAAAATGTDILDVNSTLETSPGQKSLKLLDDLLSQWTVVSHLPNSQKPTSPSFCIRESCSVTD